MRPIFVGNFEYDTRQSELERLFGKYGKIERVDMKSGTSANGKCAELLSGLANICAIYLFWKGNHLACLISFHPTDSIILHFLHSDQSFTHDSPTSSHAISQEFT